MGASAGGREKGATAGADTAVGGRGLGESGLF